MTRFSLFRRAQPLRLLSLTKVLSKHEGAIPAALLPLCGCGESQDVMRSSKKRLSVLLMGFLS